MNRLFKTLQQEASYNTLVEDLATVSAAFQAVESRFAEKSLDQLMESIQEEMDECLTDEAHEFMQAMSEFYQSLDIDFDMSDTKDLVDLIKWQINLPPFLVEAYLNYFSDDLVEKGIVEARNKKFWVYDKIKNHSPKERLDTYLEWVGVLGYTASIWSVISITEVR